MRVPSLGLAVAVAATAAQSVAAEQQAADASVHIKISSGAQLRGADEDTKGWFGSGEQSCHVMDWYNWGDFKYACQWNHGINGYNLFYMRNDGKSFVWECACDDSLGSYDPWDLSVWTWSKTDGVACYTRDGKKYDEVEHLFDGVTCKRNVKNCDSLNQGCTKFETGGYIPGADSGGTCRKPPCYGH